MASDKGKAKDVKTALASARTSGQDDFGCCDRVCEMVLENMPPSPLSLSEQPLMSGH